MNWLSRRGGEGVVESDPPEEPTAVLRPSLGVATLFDVPDGRGHTLLDVGSATGTSFDVYARRARRVRFADLLREERRPDLASALATGIPAQPDAPYDLILLWDLLDRVSRVDRTRVVEWILARSAPKARLHLLVDASETGIAPRWSFTVVDEGRVRYEPAGPDRPAGERMLPAEVERVIAPFEVIRAFVSRSGMREYVAVRP